MTNTNIRNKYFIFFIALFAFVLFAFPGLVGAAGGGEYFHPGHPGLCFDLITGLWLPCDNPDPETTPDPNADRNSGGKKEKSPFVSFTIENQSETGFYLWLRQGSVFYYLAVSPGSKSQYTIFRNNYAYEVESCGVKTSGELDLSAQRVIRVPACTTRDWKVAGFNDMPADLLPRLVGVTVENQHETPAVVRLTGVQVIVLPIAGESSRFLTIPKGDYTVEYSVCGKTVLSEFTARSHAKIEVICP